MAKQPAKRPTDDAAIKRAIRAIDRDDAIIYDVAAEYGQMVDNVRHMRWFVEAVADEFRKD